MQPERHRASNRRCSLPSERLTKSVVERLAPADRRFFVMDTEVVGFGVTVHPSGKRTYVARYRTPEGRTRTFTIGRHGALTVDQARKRARQVLGEAAAGGDPHATKRERARGETVADLAKRFETEHLPKLKERTAYNARRALKTEILPAFGRLRVADLSASDLSRWHAAMTDRPVHANRLMQLVSSMLSLAETWGMREPGSNPARLVKRFPEKRRERFLRDAEYRRLGEALRTVETCQEPNKRPANPVALAAIRLLALTGARRGEILGLRWDAVDRDASCLRLEDSKTGPAIRVLGTASLALLDAIPKTAAHVFPSPTHLAHPLEGVRNAWETVRETAELGDVTLHTLRHSKASVAARQGLPESVIAEILGHTRPGITNRYTHFDPAPLLLWNEAVEAHIAALLDGRDSPTHTTRALVPRVPGMAERRDLPGLQ